ncbi:HAD-IIA family hydrolase [Rhodococcus spelaei]|uniref:HAD-IIA family hydrolase n=1 Tax=Rhodococcus spelaei TaxID=2546320 RepID=A0A541B804_9NOCA|nr:HAD-IIA family hydrolase [Rhodococcus spelaei]
MPGDAGRTLRQRHDVLLLDLDGTVYAGPHAIPGARDALVVDGGPRLFYVTNNASRSPASVAAHLNELGFPATESEVVTSSQSAARLLAEQLPAGAAVLVVGTEALADEVRAVGLHPVRRFEDSPVAVVQGHSPDTGWPILAEATLAIRAGAYWVASNVDTTLPTERGLCLGNGAMVAALRVATEREPVVAGKPAAPLMEDSVRRSGAHAPLMVGDRIDTDIAGANAVGMASLLVLTGVSTPADLLRAPVEHRPTYLAASLAALDADAGTLVFAPDQRVRVRRESGDIVVRVDEGVDALAVLRSVLVEAWRDPEFAAVRGEDPVSAAVADQLA